MNKLQLFHPADELEGYHGVSIVFLSRGWRLFEASYAGGTNDNPHFDLQGLLIDKRDILVWCERSELFNQTNLMELAHVDIERHK